MSEELERIREHYHKGNSLNLDTKLLALLSYVFMPFSSFVILLLEKENLYVRFHSLQGVILGALWMGWVILGSLLITIIGLIPILGAIAGLILGGLYSLVTFLLSIVMVVLWIVLMIKAYKGEVYRLPVIGEYALRHLNLGVSSEAEG